MITFETAITVIAVAVVLLVLRLVLAGVDEDAKTSKALADERELAYLSRAYPSIRLVFIGGTKLCEIWVSDVGKDPTPVNVDPAPLVKVKTFDYSHVNDTTAYSAVFSGRDIAIAVMKDRDTKAAAEVLKSAVKSATE